MNLRDFNIIQKVAVSVFLAVVIGAVFLNNPLSGYVTETEPLNKLQRHLKQVPCTQEQKDAMRSRFEGARRNGVYDDTPKENTDKFIDLMVSQCSESVPYMIEASGQPLPFSEWRSKKPTLIWFGFVSNIVQLIVAMGLLSGFVFWLFRTNDADK